LRQDVRVHQCREHGFTNDPVHAESSCGIVRSQRQSWCLEKLTLYADDEILNVAGIGHHWTSPPESAFGIEQVTCRRFRDCHQLRNLSLVFIFEAQRLGVRSGARAPLTAGGDTDLQKSRLGRAA